MEKRYTKLSDIVEIISGGTPKTSIPEYWDGAIPWLSVNDFSGDSRWVDSAEKSVTELGVQKSATKILNKGDLIISARGTVGELAELLKPMAFNQSCFGLRGKNNTDTAYLYYLLKFNMPKIKVVANGATFGTIVLDTFDRIKLESYNDISLQKKIANILSRYDEAIENNNKRIKLLEQMAQNLYKEWFVRFRFPGWQNAEFENGIPKGWEVKKVGDLLKRLSFGKTYKKDELEKEGNVVVIDQSTDDYLGFHNEEPSHKADFDNPIILFGDHSCKFVFMTKDFSLGENVIPINTININPYFFYRAINGIIETTEYKRHWAMLCSQKILVPSECLQKQYCVVYKSFIKQIESLKSKNQNLTKQRDLLLPRLMSGKLEVK